VWASAWRSNSLASNEAHQECRLASLESAVETETMPEGRSVSTAARFWADRATPERSTMSAASSASCRLSRTPWAFDTLPGRGSGAAGEVDAVGGFIGPLQAGEVPVGVRPSSGAQIDERVGEANDAPARGQPVHCLPRTGPVSGDVVGCEELREGVLAFEGSGTGQLEHQTCLVDVAQPHLDPARHHLGDAEEGAGAQAVAHRARMIEVDGFGQRAGGG